MSIESAPSGRQAASERPFRPGDGRLHSAARVRRAGRSAAALALIAVGVAVSGCSSSLKGEDDVNLVAGKRAFVAKCGSCHVLERAGTKGIVGPNLDESFRASIAEGLERSSVRGTVEGQIKIPNPEGAMPKNLVTGDTARDVAAYVAQFAARPGKDTGLLATAIEAPGAGKPAVEANGKLSIAASPSGQLAYVTNKAVAAPGATLLVMPNESGVSHNIALESGENGANTKGAVLASSNYTTKGDASVKVSLKPGVYTFFCEAPGHRAAGMYGTLKVK